MPESLGPRVLCSIEDVASYLDMPAGWDQDEGRVDMLTRLVNSQCELIHRYSKREFVSVDAELDVDGNVTVGETTRVFDVTWYEYEEREIFLGDVAAAPTVVEIRDANRTTLETLQDTQYELLPRRRAADEPIRDLWLRPDVYTPATLAPGYSVAVTATWGFPSIPEDVRQWAIIQCALPFVRDRAKFTKTFNLDTNRVEIPRALSDVVRDGLSKTYRDRTAG